MVKQMAFVHNDDRFEMMQTAQQFDFPMQLALGITAVEFGLNAKLFQKT
jgi:hypothetical protein